MAWDFAAEIHALANFDADDGSTTGTSGELLTLHANQWLTDGAKEIIHILPTKLKQKCTTATGVGTDFKVDLDGLGEVLYVTRENADAGYLAPCREIPSMYGGMATDSSNMMHYATETDPVYWIDGDNSGAATLYVKPTPTANQPAIVHHIAYPTVVGTNTSIANFPDEAEYLVVLYAAIKACQHQMNTLHTNTDIDTTAFAAINTELDETQVISDLINTQVDSAVSEIAEAATEVDAQVDTACDAMTTAAGRVNTAVALANTEFDKCSALLDLGETDSEGAVNTAAAKIITELDETQSVCDKIDADLVLAKAEIVLAKAEAAELATQTDNGGDIATALTAINTELDKVDDVIVEASTEFDKVDNVIIEGSVEIDKSTALLDLGEADSEGAVNTAISLLVTAVAQAATEADKFASATSDSQFDTNSTWDATNSQLVRVKDAVDKVSLLIESNKPASGYDAHDLLQDDDIELLGGNLAIVSAEIDRAKLHIQEWVSIGDMRVKAINSALSEADGQAKKIQIYLQQAQAKREESQSRLTAGNSYLKEAQSIVSQGNAYIAEAQAYISQAQGYASEVNARAGFSSAKSQAVQGHINTAQSYVATAQGFSNEVQSKINIANGYIAEINIRLTQAQTKREESNARIASGNAYLQEAKASSQEVEVYANEVSARIAQIGGYGQVISGYLNAAQGYAAEIQAKINIAQSYTAEANIRMARDTQKYKWYDNQYELLQKQYFTGLQFLGASVTPSKKRGQNYSDEQLKAAIEKLQ